MQKISTMQTSRKNLFQGRLAIGVDLGDRSSAYCVLNEAGEIVLEHKLATTPEARTAAGERCEGLDLELHGLGEKGSALRAAGSRSHLTGLFT